MIGNDVIDLEAARLESNWQRRGYIDKLFLRCEQHLIYNAANRENMVWLLWSMKEAAYKIYNRYTGIRSFMPQKLTCSHVNVLPAGATGRVIVNNIVYNTFSEITATYIHTIALSNSEDFTYIKTCTKNEVYKCAGNYPYVIIGGQNLIASVSHHGTFYRGVYLNNTPVAGYLGKI